MKKTKTSKTKATAMPKKNANRDASIRELDTITAQLDRNREAADAKIGTAEQKLAAAKAKAAKVIADANKRADKIIADAAKLSQQIDAAAEKAHGLALEVALSRRQALNGPLRRRQEFLRSEARRSFVPAVGIQPKSDFQVHGAVTGRSSGPYAEGSVRILPESQVPPCRPRFVRINGQWVRVIRGR